jgi:hypothetical protein
MRHRNPHGHFVNEQELQEVISSLGKRNTRRNKQDNTSQDNDRDSLFPYPMFKFSEEQTKATKINHSASYSRRISDFEDKIILLHDKLPNKVCIKFYSLLNDIATSEESETNSIILEHFSNLAQGIRTSKEKMLTEKALEKSRMDLAHKLLGKPVNKTIMIAASAVIGALLGLVVGAGIGIALTCWGGGLGALPGAVAGAAKGFAAGTALGIKLATLATATSVLGATSFGLFGFFASNKQHNNVKANAETKLAPDENGKNAIYAAEELYRSLENNFSKKMK